MTSRGSEPPSVARSEVVAGLGSVNSGTGPPQLAGTTRLAVPVRWRPLLPEPERFCGPRK